MNERIREIWENNDSISVVWPETGSPVSVSAKTLEKFAELIVRECAEITDGLSKLYPRTDVAFDVGYTMGTSRATKEIKQHFGVEE